MANLPDGVLDAQLVVSRPPRSDSLQHASLASALDTTGAPAGFFAGAMDEARIWNYARTAAQIASTKNLEVPSATGLIGRWGMNEGTGTTVFDTSGTGNNGTLVNSPAWTAGFDTNTTAPRAPIVTRGPYLQMGTPTSTTVRWRTDLASDSYVRYGPAPGSLGSISGSSASVTNHIVTLSNLNPDTLYYYSVGTASNVLAGDNTNHLFITSPRAGSPAPTRIWVLGDCGTQTAAQYQVRDAYYQFTGARETDLWLMLGDNAYNSGTDAEYQGAVFNTYAAMLRKSVLWSTLGNHETAQSTAYVDTYPYFDMFTFPKNGEAGGVASGTEHYYSFDFGNIHFVCLDSMTAGRATNGTMATWLRADLEAAVSDWLIAFWHHPPYTKGSHDSDTEIELVEMRKNFLPILESYGVDLVLSGHSHSYERSFLLDSHYGTSSTLSGANLIDSGSGRDASPYMKPAGLWTHRGAVYAVAGSSGQTSGGSLNHPAMFISLNLLGSMVVDVVSNRLDATFLDNTRVVRDYFTIVKSGTIASPPTAPGGLNATVLSSSQVSLSWVDQSVNESGFEIERSLDKLNYGLIATTGPDVISFTDTSVLANKRYYYRVRAFNAGGSSGYSNVVQAKTPPR